MSKAISRTTMSCNVSQLAEEAAALCRGIHAAEAAREDDSALVTRLLKVEAEASRLVAASPLGALFQVALASHLSDLLHALAPETEPQKAECEEIFQSIMRLLYAVRLFVEASSGVSAAGTVAEVYMSDALNPLSCE